MELELDICELGIVLKKIEEKYKLDILIKSTLSGGWLTIRGTASILKCPNCEKAGCSGKGDNIIDIRVENEESQDGMVIKITGAKDKKFKIDISSTRYKEINPNNLTINQIKINENESKLRVDESIIFTIAAPVDEISKLIER